jgi:putative heme-binding domain-containing protein
MPLLTAQDEALRQTAWETIAARPDWSAGIERLIRQLCEGSETRLIDLDTMHGAVVAFAHVQAVQEQIGELLVSPRVNSLVRARLLRAIGEAPTAQWPASWKPGVIKAIDRSQRDVQWAAVRAVAAREQAEFAPHLETIVENPKAPMGMRVDSAVGLAHFARPLNGTAYALLNAQLQTDDALSRLEAARAIGRAKLNEVQLTELASATSKLGTLELSAVIGAFAQSQDATIGLALMDALRKSPAMKTVSASRRTEAFANFPAEIKTQAAELFAADSSTATQQAQRLDFLLNGLTTGDAERGRELFFGRRAACASCHRVGSNGATVGPDLSTVGVRRSARDLIEAIAFPSASIARGFESFTFTTTRGKIHAGIILNQTPAAIQIRTGSQDVLWLDRGDVEEISPSPVSIMPEGLDRTLTATELSDLTAYLKSRK